ncbi:MAG: alpha-L-fucosidase, partial [Armatimonadia bacterium]
KFSVASSGWQHGQGDVVRDFVAACRKHDMHPGLYYSPAEAGDAFKQDAKAYDDYFINQISEILVPYGPIDVLWFDGCGSADHQYDWARITDEIRRMQPEVQIFSMGTDPNFRWVGNESGIAPVPSWNTVRYDVFDKVDGNTPVKWLPAECDCRMRQQNWFYSDQDEDTVKSLEQLRGLYYYSVGRGCNLLINIGPDRRGLLPDKDRTRLLEFGEEVRRRFGKPLAGLGDFKQSESVWTYAPEKPVLMDHVVVQEDLTTGERVRKFEVEAYVGGGPADWVKLWDGYSIGHKAICRFPLLQVYQVRLKVTEADGEVRLRSLEIHQS